MLFGRENDIITTENPAPSRPAGLMPPSGREAKEENEKPPAAFEFWLHRVMSLS